MRHDQSMKPCRTDRSTSIPVSRAGEIDQQMGTALWLNKNDKNKTLVNQRNKAKENLACAVLRAVVDRTGHKITAGSYNNKEDV